MNVVIGYGVVGQATAYAFKIDKHYDLDPKKTNFDFHDSTKGFNNRYFICVPTPTNDEQNQDISALIMALGDVSSNDSGAVCIIRSTVLPGTCKRLQNMYKDLTILHMPEFLTESTAFEDTKHPDFVYVGGEDFAARNDLAKFIESKIDCNVRQVSWETSELIKYAMNTFFGTKVVLGNIFRDLAEATNADYWSVKEALQTHKWGSINGWNPFFGNKRGFGGKCLPKDIGAISQLDMTGFLDNLLEVNELYRDE